MQPPQKPFSVKEDEDGMGAIVDALGRVVLCDAFQGHDNAKAEGAWMRRVADALNQQGDCPKCGGELTQRNHTGNFLAPDAVWNECEDCGFKSNPQ